MIAFYIHISIRIEKIATTSYWCQKCVKTIILYYSSQWLAKPCALLNIMCWMLLHANPRKLELIDNFIR